MIVLGVLDIVYFLKLFSVLLLALYGSFGSIATQQLKATTKSNNQVFLDLVYEMWHH